jgi:hypothetical protein
MAFDTAITPLSSSELEMMSFILSCVLKIITRVTSTNIGKNFDKWHIF